MKYFWMAAAAALFMTAPGLNEAAAQQQQQQPQQQQQQQQVVQPSQNAAAFAQDVAHVCLNNWDSPSCLQIVSASNHDMLSRYGGTLQQHGQYNAADVVMDQCAASTAAAQQEVPADAMLSANIQCANTISEITSATGIRPDIGQYQLMVGSVLCLAGDERCAAIHNGLMAYR